MQLDEESNSGFSVALSAPGQANVTEEGSHGPLAASLEARTGANMSMCAPVLATTHGDSAVRVFSPHCSPCYGRRKNTCTPAAPFRSASTWH